MPRVLEAFFVPFSSRIEVERGGRGGGGAVRLKGV